MTCHLIPTYEELLDTPTTLLSRLLAPTKNNSFTLYETKEEVIAEAAVPGIEPADLQVTFEKGILMIEGSCCKEKKEEKCQNRLFANYSYRIAIPYDIDESVTPSASCKNGIVTIAFPKSKSQKPMKIAVKGE